MWGNRLGWVLSAISVIGVVGFLFWMNAIAERVAPRTTASSDPQFTGAIELPIAASTVVPSRNNADAGPIYRRAIEQYLQNPRTYEMFARSGRVEEIRNVPAIKLLLEASDHSTARIFQDHPSEVVNYINEKPALEAVRHLGVCARVAGQLIQRDRPAEAMKHYEAAFALGSKLYAERLTWMELDTGLGLMAENAKMIAALATTMGDTAKAESARQFDQARIQYVNQRLLPALRVITSADAALIDQHAGDIVYFARSANDRLWRDESILKLGRLRFHAARPGDQRIAMKVIQELSGDPDPIIRAAADAARDLTIEQYRMIR